MGEREKGKRTKRVRGHTDIVICKVVSLLENQIKFFLSLSINFLWILCTSRQRVPGNDYFQRMLATKRLNVNRFKWHKKAFK